MSITRPATTQTLQNTKPIDPPRRPDSHFLLGDLPHFQADRVGYFTDTGKINPMVRFRMAYIDNLLVTDAEIAQEILQKRSRNYVKEPRLNKVLETGGDKVLFTTDGDDWLWRRRLMQPAFHRRQIAQFCSAIVSETEAYMATWQSGQTYDIDEAMKLVTMQIIGRTMFNVDMLGDSAELHEAYRILGDFLIERISNPFPLPVWVPTKANREFKEVQSTIVNALQTIMDDRRQSAQPHNDLLDMLLTMVDVEGGFTQNQMIFEMSSIVFAGHETTATTLTWLLYMLTQHPAVERKLYEEVDTVLEGRTPMMDDLANLSYLNRVINETLRLYPAARATTRRAIEGDVIGGYSIRPGENIFINIRGIHTDPRYWNDPYTFDPDRFLPERTANRHKWAFIPFLNGPRKCIGEPLSRAEMQLILVMILQRFRFTFPEGAVVEEDAGFVLRPKDGLDLIVTTR